MSGKMSLSEWSKLTGILPTHPTTEHGAVSLLCSVGEPHRAKLWQLTNYKVSTVSGPVVWLVPYPRQS
jgi:hypothetical protein